MLLQAALNGSGTKAGHPATPVTDEELAADAKACAAAGARAVHVHPRDDDGGERLDPRIVDRVVTAVKDACGLPVGVSTGAWIEPDLNRRVELIRSWRAPDYASVNLSEPGWTKVMEACLEAGVSVEAGVWCVEDAAALAASGLGPLVLRVLVEPVEAPAGDALALADAIHAALDRHRLRAPRLQHGAGKAAWPLLADAARRGVAARIGLEDTFCAPDGTLAAGNAALVRSAIRL